MSWWAVLAVLCALYLGYAIGVLNHDRDRHRWQLAWLIGRAGQHETRLRRIELDLALPALKLAADPPAPATLTDRVRAAWRRLSERTRPQPAAPDPEPPTAPITQVDPVDPWRARFNFSGGDRP